MKKLLILAGCFLAVFGMVSFANALPFSDVTTVNWSFGNGTSHDWTFDLDNDALAVGDIGPEDTILSSGSVLKVRFTDDSSYDYEIAKVFADGVSEGTVSGLDISGTESFTAGIYAAIVGDHELLVRIDQSYGDFGVNRLELAGNYTDNPTDNPSAAVPEPCTMLLLGSGLLGLVGLRKKFKK